MDKARLWRVDPSEHFQSDIHNLVILIERANHTNDNSMPDKNIPAILYEEISKDPKESLGITALNCQQLQQGEVLSWLLAPAGATPMNRAVNIHSMESKTTTPKGFRLQVNKYPFDDKCKYRHIEDPNRKIAKKLKIIMWLIKRN